MKKASREVIGPLKINKDVVSISFPKLPNPLECQYSKKVIANGKSKITSVVTDKTGPKLICFLSAPYIPKVTERTNATKGKMFCDMASVVTAKIARKTEHHFMRDNCSLKKIKPNRTATRGKI
jgi:hypothetical protein